MGPLFRSNEDAQPDDGRQPLVEPLRPRRRLIAAGAVGVAAVAAAVVGVIVASGGDGDEQSAGASRSTATTTIRRQDLVETEDLDGTLGYSGARTVINRLPGTVTRTPRVGSVVRTNRSLYELDGSAVYLLHGTYPAYRTLQPGLKGPDVRQLERNLRRLGLDAGRDMKVDRTWDAGTTAAVKRWQSRKGMPQDGEIEKGRIVFQRGSRRVGEIILPVGSSAGGGGGGESPASFQNDGAARTIFATAPSGQAGGGSPGGSGGGGSGGASGTDVAAPLMRTTSTKRIVAVDLETTKQDLADEGAAVSVELPDGEDVAGTIARVGKVAQKKSTPQDDDPPATIAIVIKLKTSTGTGLDQAPVDVTLEKRRAKDVLVVPVTALLARAGREFGVEVRNGAGRRVVPVKTGLYTDSYVEIEGPGLRAGLKVTDAKI